MQRSACLKWKERACKDRLVEVVNRELDASSNREEDQETDLEDEDEDQDEEVEREEEDRSLRI
jgi:hypothetical protein